MAEKAADMIKTYHGMPIDPEVTILTSMVKEDVKIQEPMFAKTEL